MTAPVSHPTWCDRAHPADWLHSMQVGADLDLSGDLAYAVQVQQLDDEPATVILTRHTPDETIVTRLTPLEAGILRDLLGEGLALLASDVGR